MGNPGQREGSDEVDRYLPLTPRVFLILWALAGEDHHGYRLLQRVEDLSRGRVTMKPGSLYEAIATLAERGLIAEREGDRGSRRRIYGLTRLGREVLDAEASRLGDLVSDFEATAGRR